MNFAGAQYIYGLTATGTAEGVNSAISGRVGTAASINSYTTAPDIVYSLGMEISEGDTLTLDTATGAVTGTVAGVNQVETATVIAASGCTGNGNATVVFTSPLVTGSPLTTSVALTTALNTATLVAGAIRTALQGVAAITAHYTIGGTGSTITATAIAKAANDTTLNISTANGTCTGLTSAPSSANTTAGVGTSRAYRISGTTWDTKDAEGITLAAATKVYGFLVKVTSTGTILGINSALGEAIFIQSNEVILKTNQEGLSSVANTTLDFAATAGNAVLTLDIHAGT